MNIYKSFILSFLSLFIWTVPLQSEIQSIQVYWTHGACRDSCAKLLQEKLLERKAIESAFVSVQSNMAEIQWNKDEPFSYEIIKRAFQRTGVSIDNVRLVVRGKIEYNSDKMILISDGDNTPIEIVSYSKEKPNSKYLSLDPKFKQTYLDYSRNKTTLIIEGALYQPHRAPPLYLLLEKVTVAEEKKDKVNN